MINPPKLTRRQFTSRAFASLLLAGSLPALLPLAGCPQVTQSQLAALIGEVGAGLAEILPYLKSVSATSAATIYQAFQALETAVQNWKPGAVVSEIEQAVNAFVSAMSLVPVLAAYQPLVALIVATAEGLISLLVPAPAPATSTSAMNTGASGKVTVMHEHGKIVVNYQGVVVTNPPTTAGKFKSMWNAKVKADSALAGYALS